MTAVLNLSGLAKRHKAVAGSPFSVASGTERRNIAEVHKPFHHFIESSLVGNIKLLRIMRSFFVRVSANGSSGRTGNLGNPHGERFLPHFFRLSGRDNHPGIGYGNANAGNDFRKDFIINSVVKLGRINVIGLFQSRYGYGVRAHAVHGFQVLRVHEKPCELITILIQSEENTDSHIIDSPFHRPVHRFRMILIVVLRSGRM